MEATKSCPNCNAIVHGLARTCTECGHSFPSAMSEAVIKRRNMWMQVLLYIVTFSIYGIYWFYVSSKEMVTYKKLDGDPALWTFLMFIPFAGIYSVWKHSESVSAFTDKRYGQLLIFILWLFFSPAVWAITQIELNRLATEDT